MDNLRDLRDKTIEKEYVSWNDVENFIDKLSKTINLKNFNGVYGPARGGVVFACILSNRYNLPYLGAPQDGCMVVDDICDSGNAAMAWKEKGYFIATMYYKENNLVIPDFYLKEKVDNWVIFPWERDNR